MNSTADRTIQVGRRARAVARHRLSAAVGLGLSAGLVLSACGTADEPAESPSATTDPSSSPVETVTESPSPTADQTTMETETSSPSSPSEDTDRDPLAGPTQTYTTESGTFTWTFPETWTASQEDYNEENLDYLGVPYEEVLFQDAEQAVEFRATTGIGPTDNDGPKPDVVGVLEAEELPEIPVNEGENATGSGPVWYRAALLQANEDIQDSGRFDGQEFLLSVQVVNMPEDVDPEGTDESFWSAWFYEQPPAEGFEHGAATFLPTWLIPSALIFQAGS
ncbi:hypothetical protein LG284_02125 [Citricoccus nitrophenolicus]